MCKRMPESGNDIYFELANPFVLLKIFFKYLHYINRDEVVFVPGNKQEWARNVASSSFWVKPLTHQTCIRKCPVS